MSCGPARPATPQTRTTPGSPPFPGAYWRELLISRWQAELVQVTELSLAFQQAAEAADAATGHPASRDVRRLEWRTVAARRALADTEEALGRLSAGRYGQCEQCAAEHPGRLAPARPGGSLLPGLFAQRGHDRGDRDVTSLPPPAHAPPGASARPSPPAACRQPQCHRPSCRPPPGIRVPTIPGRPRE